MNEKQEPDVGQESVPLVTPLRRRPSYRRTVYTHPPHYGRMVSTLLFIILLVSGGFYFYLYRTSRYAINLDGRQLLVVDTRAQAFDLIQKLKLRYAPNDPSVVRFQQENLTIKTVEQPATMMSTDSMVQLLDDKLTIVLSGEAIYVNGKPQMMVSSPDTATEAISLMLFKDNKNKRGVPTFKQRVVHDNVTLVEGQDSFLPVMTPQQAANELVHPPQPSVHIVQSGDCFWSIGNENHLTIEQVKSLNPGVDPGALQPGDPIKLPDKPSLVSIVMRPASSK